MAKLKRPIRKRFLLLEVMLALGLIASCTVLFVKPHLFIQKEEILFLEKMQLDAIASESFGDIKILLYENSLHPFETLAQGVEGNLLGVSINIGGGKKRLYEREYRMIPLNQDKKQSAKGFLLLVELYIKGESGKIFPRYTTTFFVEGQSKLEARV